MAQQLKEQNSYVIGIISDTHGVLPENVEKIFSGTDMIIHAGDIGGHKILDALRKIAPVIAVRGKIESDKWMFGLNETEEVRIGDVSLYVLHDVHKLDVRKTKFGVNAVVSGYSHKASYKKYSEIHFLNPGSACKPKYSCKPSVALLHIEGKSLDVKFKEFEL